jgi:hypothetical protein
MPVKNTFTLPSNNVNFMTLFEWVATLSIEEQDRFRLADQRQVNHRQNAIDKGHMIIDPQTNDYIWKDNETAKNGKKTDRVWLEFWHRYVDECNINFESTFKEE